MADGSDKIRLLLVDDHPLVVEGIRATIEEAGDELELVGASLSGPEAIAEIDELAPDVVLLDVQLPGVDGLSVLDVLTTEGVETKVVILTARLDEGLIDSAYELGAAAVLEKTIGWTEIVEAVKRVARGEDLPRATVDG